MLSLKPHGPPITGCIIRKVSKVCKYEDNFKRIQGLSKSVTIFFLVSIQDDPIVLQLDKTVSVTPSMSKSETGGKHRGAFKQLR